MRVLPLVAALATVAAHGPWVHRSVRGLGNVPGNNNNNGKRGSPNPGSCEPGAPCANLRVRTDLTSSQWLVRDENIDAASCAAVEGGITSSGVHRVIRFTVGIGNFGDADSYVGDPNVHFSPYGDYQNGVSDGTFEYAPCHRHYHFRHYAEYALISVASGKVWRAAKRGFCMLDTDPNPARAGAGAPKAKYFNSCGSPASAGNQGVSAGWTDTYRFWLSGQFFVVDGSDGQDPIPAGDYTLRITANPAFVPASGEPCPFVDAATGLCHTLQESDYADNVGEVRVTIPDPSAHPGRLNAGPAANAPDGSATDPKNTGAKVKGVAAP